MIFTLIVASLLATASAFAPVARSAHSTSLKMGFEKVSYLSLIIVIGNSPLLSFWIICYCRRLAHKLRWASGILLACWKMLIKRASIVWGRSRSSTVALRCWQSLGTCTLQQATDAPAISRLVSHSHQWRLALLLSTLFQDVRILFLRQSFTDMAS